MNGGQQRQAQGLVLRGQRSPGLWGQSGDTGKPGCVPLQGTRGISQPHKAVSWHSRHRQIQAALAAVLRGPSGKTRTRTASGVGLETGRSPQALLTGAREVRTSSQTGSERSHRARQRVAATRNNCSRLRSRTTLFVVQGQVSPQSHKFNLVHKNEKWLIENSHI